MKQTILSLIFLPLSAALVFAQDPSWHQVPAEDLRGNRGEIARTIQSTQDEAKLLEVWQRPEVDEPVLYLKMLAAKRLGIYGTAASIPVLVPRLDNDKDGFYARYALETIPGTEVDVALGEALKTIEKPAVIAGILTTLGVRGNPVSAASVRPFLTHENTDVRRAAAYATALTARGTFTSLFKEEDIPFPVDSAFLLAEQSRQRGDNALAASIYATIQIGALRTTTPGVSSPGGFIFDTKEYQRWAAEYHQYDVEVRSLNGDPGPRLRKQLDPTSPRRQFEMGLKAGRELPADAEATVARMLYSQFIRQTDPLRGAKIIRALGDRTDEDSKLFARRMIAPLVVPRDRASMGTNDEARADVLVAMRNDVAVRVAAIDALRNVGDASVITRLVAAVTQTDEPLIADAARKTLTELPGTEVDLEIRSLLANNGTPAVKVVLISIVAERRIFTASPILLKLLQDSDATVVEAAVSALGQVSSIDDLPMLLGLLKGASSEAEATKFLGVLKSACTRFSQDDAAAKVANVLNGSTTVQKTQLLDLLKEIAGAKALTIVEEYAWGDDAAMRNVATRILGEWRSPPDLDQLAAACLKLAKESQEYKTRGLRSYIRLARQFDMPEDRRLQMCQEVFDLADRDEERMLIFDVFARQSSMKALEKAASFLDNATLSERAAETSVEIAKKLQGRQPQAGKIMEAVIKTTKSAAVKLQAESLLTKFSGGNEGIEIVKAIYGAGDKTADVTSKVSNLSGGSSVFDIGSYNAAFGDVASGVVKTLKITYKIKGGPEKTVEFTENAPIALPTQ